MFNGQLRRGFYLLPLSLLTSIYSHYKNWLVEFRELIKMECAFFKIICALLIAVANSTGIFTHN